MLCLWISVIINQVLFEEVISVLYIDYRTFDKVHYKDVRLFHSKFLTLPTQAICQIVEQLSVIDISRLMVGPQSELPEEDPMESWNKFPNLQFGWLQDIIEDKSSQATRSCLDKTMPQWILRTL